ncbi:MAG TPA: 4-(cytidine 5'-diphospho)-2-C-methyl-D-erythritol kinase [Allosphingosinicella sp.]|nr:4-(cytidine 5'-diphospho)-2-C-methyl-D-erythritol kinase [Allosphingosinicella sp.]
MEEVAYAKINLALHVRAREPDGYHRIETLFAFAEDGDRLEVEDADALSLEVTGPFGRQLGRDNLVSKAAEALRSRYGVSRGAALTLDKRLPVAAGIGGGSADAAAALRLLVRWWELPFEEDVLLEIASGLGADVPACLRSELARGTGRGDRLATLDGTRLAGTPLLLVNPGVQLSTATVFARWDGVDRGPLGEDPPSWRNDLEEPACTAVPVVREVLDLLGSLGSVTLRRMSGSGATCFALFERGEDRDSAAASIAASDARWWTLATSLR